jgi:integrase
MAAALDAWLYMIATALRPTEARLTQWGQIDLQKKLATVAAARMKGREGKTKPHIVPLAALAVEVLERRDRVRVRAHTGDKEKDAAADAAAFVFAGANGAPSSHTYFALAPWKAGIKPLLADRPKTPIGTLHSWRSVFRDWAADLGNIPPDLAEMALAHRLPKIQAAYRRDSGIGPRTPMMEAYSRWLTGDADSNVIAYPKRAV